MDKKAQIDFEVLSTPGFVILVAMSVGATITGYFLGPQMGIEQSFALWKVLIIIILEVIVCYVIVARG